MNLRAGLLTLAQGLGRVSRAIWAACRPGRGPSGRGNWVLDELRRRYVFGGITRAELEEGIRKIRGRFRRGR